MNTENNNQEESQSLQTLPTNNTIHFYIIIGLLVVIAVLAFFAGKNQWQKLAGPVSAEDVVVTILDDKKCPEETCNTKALTEQLKSVPFLSGATFETMDFADQKTKTIMTQNEITTLPAVLVNTNQFSDASFVTYLKATKAGKYALQIGAEYDPYGEVCDNKVDDNEDGKVDCEDPKCGKELSCAKKVQKPVADLYIMSYCPYGLQAQKGYLEVMSKLGKVADVNIKWVPYIMHGKKEAEENVVQDCIQKEQKDKYTKYLNCFLAEEGKGEACRKEAKIDEKKLSSCIATTKKAIDFDAKMADTSKQYPEFGINKEEADKAGVQGSPTFVLNGIKVEKVGRSAKSYAQAICSTFENKPKECEQEFQDITFDAMFGFTTGNGSAQANSGCGQ